MSDWDRAGRTARWVDWMGQVRARHLATPFGSEAPPETKPFWGLHYTHHQPAVLNAPLSPAMDWTLDSLRQKAPDMEVQVQAGRLGVQNYERESHRLRTGMSWHRFLDQVANGADNSVYLTANNHAQNSGLMQHLAPDLMPLPPELRPNPQAGFLWLGKGTLTPTHHDLTDNVLVQLVGERKVRIMPPAMQQFLDNRSHVHSDHACWIDDEVSARLGLWSFEVTLKPGDMLYMPVGWWHCVYSPGISMMASFTNLWWPNHWQEGFPY